MSAAPASKPWLVAGLILGVGLAMVPFVVTIASVVVASDVEGGLRQATITEGKEEDVGRALGSASLSAILMPPGILLAVLCGLALRPPRRRQRSMPSRGTSPSGTDDSDPPSGSAGSGQSSPV